MKTRSPVILALLVASSATVASAAQADTCPAPLLVQCRDPDYLATACGQAATADESSACSVLLRDAYRAELQKPEVAVGEVMVPGQPGTTTVAGVKPYKFQNHLARNLTGEFLGVEQKSQLLAVGGGQLNLFADGLTQLGVANLKTQRDGWAANGNTVRSCAEYAQERFQGYAQWKDLADVSLLSDEALFDKAFDPAQGIANKTLYSRSGATALPPVEWPSNGALGTIIVGGRPQQVIDHRVPKNGFFKQYRSLAKGSFFKPEDAALKSKLMQGQSHHVVDWNWHKQMHDALASSYDEETLRYYEDLQADFARIAGQREGILALIAKHGPTLTTTDPPSTRNLSAELASLDAALRAELVEADANGCLDPVNPTQCDWSYKQLRDEVTAFYSKKMETAFQKCVENTGDDFGPNALIHKAQSTFGAHAKGIEDYATSAENVEKFPEVVSSWVAAQAFPVDANGRPYLGDRKSDSGTIGSSDLSLDWSYDAGWAIQNLTKEGKGCEAGVKVDGAFKAVGHAYGTDVNVIDAAAELSTEQQKGKAKVKLTVLDQKVWDRWDNPYTSELSAGLVKDMKSGTSKEFTTTIHPFGIPVTLGAGVGMSVGLKVNAKVTIGGSCQTNPTVTNIDLASMSGSVTPWAQADAFASAAVGIPGFRAGIKCNVVVVRGEMPITANAKLSMTTAKQVNAMVSLTGKQTFRMLDGNIKAFVDGPFDFMDSEWTVFSWQGPKIDQEVFRLENSTLPLDLMKSGLPSSS